MFYDYYKCKESFVSISKSAIIERGQNVLQQIYDSRQRVRVKDITDKMNKWNNRTKLPIIGRLFSTFTFEQTEAELKEIMKKGSVFDSFEATGILYPHWYSDAEDRIQKLICAAENSANDNVVLSTYDCFILFKAKYT